MSVHFTSINLSNIADEKHQRRSLVNVFQLLLYMCYSYISVPQIVTSNFQTMLYDSPKIRLVLAGKQCESWL